MVPLPTVLSSNTTLPSHLTAVIVGGTSGIGESTLYAFGKSVQFPRAYFVGRSQVAADAIVKTCKGLNPNGEYLFVKGDVSLMAEVERVCGEIKSMERERKEQGKEGSGGINLLVQSQGTLDSKTETSESLPLIMALHFYSRILFTTLLLPSVLIAQPPTHRRVVLVFGGGFEGHIHESNLPARDLSLFTRRDHLSAMLTLSLETMSQMAPGVGFAHSFPGLVNTQGLQNIGGIVGWGLKLLIPVLGWAVCVPLGESGERHLFLGTGRRYPAKERGEAKSDVEVEVARGTDGVVGSGVYSVRENGESSGPKVEGVLAEYRKSGMRERVWKHTEGEIRRITEKGLGGE